MFRTIKEVQEEFALSSGLLSEIIWDSLAPDESDILKSKIESLFPISDRNPNVVQKMRATLFDNVWAQRKYTNRALLSSIIYVLVCDETDFDIAPYAVQFSCHAVFRTMKCMNDNNSAGCCMIYIDEHGRVYQNWKKYLAKNLLPSGTMVAPKNGIYTFNKDDTVELEVLGTPQSKPKSKMVRASDIIATTGGLAATVPIAAAILTPVAAPVLAAATVMSVSTAVYTTARSVLKLHDRRQHEQSISLANREARGSWLGVASGVVGVGAVGATKAFTSAAVAGREMSLATKIAVNSVNVSSMALSGTGFLNGVIDLFIKIHDGETIKSLDVLQLASSLLVFTHSVNNFKIASKVVTSNDGISIGQRIRNQMFKTFERYKRPTGGYIVRTVNDIPVQNVLMNLHKFNTKLSADGIVPAIVSTLLPRAITTVNGENVLNVVALAEELGEKFVQHISSMNSFLDVFSSMAQYFNDSAFRLLLNLARTFINNNIDDFDRILSTSISTENLLYKIFKHCITNYPTFSFEFLEAKTGEILKSIEDYYNSLVAVNAMNARRACRECKGYYFVCKL